MSPSGLVMLIRFFSMIILTVLAVRTFCISMVMTLAPGCDVSARARSQSREVKSQGSRSGSIDRRPRKQTFREG